MTKEKPEIEKLTLNSTNIPEERQNELLRLFPEVRTEGGKIDFEKLKLTLGTIVDTGKERYGINWPGKAECVKTIQTPSLGTLRPKEKESLNFSETENIFIEGDNLEVLKLLRKGYLNQIKMIYIDPPYNTGKDFIYPDNYTESLQTYLEYTGQTDSQGKKYGTNSDTDGRFHSKWLNMMYPRLFLAWSLLRENGAILISIDDKELTNLRKVCDEIFGEECFVATFPWRSRTAKADVPYGVSVDVEWIVCYAKSEFIAGRSGERKYFNSDDYQDRWRLSDLTTNKTKDERPNSYFPLINPRNKEKFPASAKRTWAVTKDTFDEYFQRGKIVFPGDYDFLNISTPAYRVFESEDKKKALEKYGTDDIRMSISSYLNEKEIGRTEHGTKEIRELFNEQVFNYPKPTSLIKFFIQTFTNDGDMICDFFAGSGTTGHAVWLQNAEESLNRKFILIQLPEPLDPDKNEQKTACDYCDKLKKPRLITELTKERLRLVANQLHADKKIKDLGFKVFSLSESNFKIWDSENIKNENLGNQLELHVDHVKQDRTPDDILYEILLKSGFALTTKVETQKFGKQTVFSVAGGMLLVCLEDNLTLDLIKHIADQKPERVVCLDHGFANNDELKANAVQIFRTKGITSFKTV